MLPAHCAPGGLTVQEALRLGSRRLAEAGCEQPRLDAEILLAYLLGTGRGNLFAHPERCLAPGEVPAWQALLQRRAAREPVAYITGRRAFYDLELAVDARVLVPRPETELLVERALALAAGRPAGILWDVGTGSGALALTLAHHLPGARIVASDLSADALEVAAQNRRRLGLEARVRLVRADLLAAAAGPLDLVVANLPYVPTAEYLRAMPEVSRHEPRLALDGGETGLALVERLLAQAAALDPQPGTILLEIGAGQGPAALALASQYFPTRSASLWRDLAGLDRLLEILPSPPGGEGGVRGGFDGQRPLPMCPEASLAAMRAAWRGNQPSPPSPFGGPPSPSQGEGSCPPLKEGGVRGDTARGERHKGSPLGGEVRILPASDPRSIALAAGALQRGEVVAFPTDTVYGLGAALDQEAAVQALYEIKGRPEGKAIPLLLAAAGDLGRVAAVVPPAAARLVRRFWPGPLTLVLPAKREIPAVVRAGGPSVAVRVPDHPAARALIEAAGRPLATTSANRSGAPEALTAAEVVQQLGNSVRWVVDGGPSPGGTPSTVVDLTVDPPVIRRLGAIPAEELEPYLSPPER